MITQDDVIYFVLTDRFRNADPANDAPSDPSHPKRYHGGDFAGLIERIPYFQKLGITAVWITPVYLSIGRFFDSDGYHGYWAMDFDKVDPHLYSQVLGRSDGSREYLEDLVKSFHSAGLKVVLDMVVNHTGYHNDEYIAYPNKVAQSDWFNQGGSTEVDQELSGLPDLDHDQVKVADYFIQNILDWIDETGIDGIRMDTVKHVEDPFWYFFKSCIKTARPDVTLIGEVLVDDPQYIGRYQQEHDFDTLFDFPLRKTIKATLVENGPMTWLARSRYHDDEPKGTLDVTGPYTNANRLVTLLDNHDLEARITTNILDRWGHWDRDRARRILKLCLSFLLTTRGIPQIYYGTEIGMEGRSDPDNRRDMPWDLFDNDHCPRPEHIFERDIFDHLSAMIKLRQEHEAIRYGYLLTLYVDQFVYAYMREFRGDVVIVAINNGLEDMPDPMNIEIGSNTNIPPRIVELVEGKILNSSTHGVSNSVIQNGNLQIQIPGKTAGIFTL